MANKEINDLTAAVSLSLTDNFEIQQLAGLSKKASGQKMLDLVTANLSVEQTRYVSQTGSDITGTGSEFNPWATLNYAYSQIPDAAVYKPYSIQVLTGYYIWEVVNIKPHIMVNFNDSQIIISDTVQLDDEWLDTSGVFIWENILNANFTMYCSFLGSSFGSVVKLSNIRSENSSIFAFVGSNTVVPIVFVDNMYGYTPPQIQMTDSVGIIRNCRLSSLDVSNYLINCNYEMFSISTGNLSIITSSNDPISASCNSCRVSGNTNIICYGSGNMNVSLTDTPFVNTPVIDATPGGGSIDLTYDYINSNISPLGAVTLKPLIPSLVWGKFQIYGQTMSTTIVNAGTTPSAFNFSGSTFNDTYDKVGISVNPSSGVLGNNSGVDRYFRISSKVCFVGVGFDSDLEFMHVIDGTTIIESSITQGSAVVPGITGGITEINIETDAIIPNGSTMQIMVRAIDLNVKNIKVISLTHRMNAN